MRVVNISGVPTEVEETEIDTEDVILDEGNPRISFFKDSQVKGMLEQKEITYALTNKNPQAFDKLKESIEANKGILYPIWVVKTGDGSYKVIEGNTRLVIYRQLREKSLDDTTYKRIPCWVLPGDVSEEQMNFLRLEAHLRGSTDWDTYEKARYLFKLNEDEGYSVRMLERLTKLSRNEIKSHIEAFKDMEQQYLPEYGKDPSQVFKFSYFVEYEKNTKLKDLMRKNDLGIGDFCDWVGKEMIYRAQDVRELPSLLETEEARKVFVEKGFDMAMEKLDVIKPDKTSKFFSNVERVVEGLRNLPSWEISEMKDGMQPGRLEILNKLSAALKKTRELIGG